MLPRTPRARRPLLPDPQPPLAPREPGTYVLLLRLNRAVRLEIGRLGQRELAAGWYVYVGSALAGLQPRLARHLRRDKPRRWHVDYLRELAEPVGLAYRIGRERLECGVAASLAARPEARPVPRFGASDCRCASHLIGFRRQPSLALGPGWIERRPRPETGPGRMLGTSARVLEPGPDSAHVLSPLEDEAQGA